MRSKAPLALLLAAVLLSACSGGGDKKAAPTPSPTASPTPSPTLATPVVVAKDWLTGTAPRRTAPLVAIKVDNAGLAWPYQRGLRQAALVYQELVEGGSTRLLAVLESDVAGGVEVGPVRSVRESDIELLRQYGGISVGFSGGNTGVKAIFHRAANAHQVVDASYDAIPAAYRLGERRKDARNFFTTPQSLAGRRPGVGPRDIGLRFGPALAGGLPATTAAATFSPRSTLRLRYDAAHGIYVLYQSGDVLPVAPVNVLVQYVRTRASGFRDVTGQATPYTVSTGSGKAVLLRDGQRWIGTWTRSGFGATHFRDRAGHDLLLKPGPTWVVLLPTSGGLSLG